MPNWGGTIISALGGSGDDQFVLYGSTAGKTTVNLGAGNDRLVIKGTLAAGAVLDGGADANTLVFDDNTDVSAYTSAALFKAAVLDFQTLEVSDAADTGITVDTAVAAGFTAYEVLAGSVTFQNLSATTAISVIGDVDALVLDNTAALNTAGTATVALTIDNGASDAADGLTVTTLDTQAGSLTIHSNGLIGDADAANSVTLLGAVSANLTSVVIDGSQAVDFHTGALTALGTAAGTLTIDASTATGSVLIDAAAATAVVNMNGGSAADVLTAGIAGGTIYGGAGGDSIDLTATTGVGAVDTIVYKAASDSVYSLATSGALGSGIDTITNFVSGTDKIDLTGLGLTASSVIVDKTAASLSALTTLAASATFYNDSTNTARSVVEVTVGSDTYLFVDANKDHKFDASTDLVIHLTGATQTVAAGDIIFA